ncbi:dual specificity protein phosphatase MPK-4-like [Zophobas morio]|uniref:dual specificity protein phosphatase MPK-4-like n=1 Tax=Zophobas morio TaxID=2755281 RepID=UPI0030827932
MFNLIEPNLYLGCRQAAENVNILNKHKITHILTIEDKRLSPKITNNESFTTKFIFLYDLLNQNLLNHLEDTYAFILEGMLKGTVLVHCLMGVSRSASVVIAFMMKKYQLTYEEAYEKVNQKRRIYPNPGFEAQLKLYEAVGCQLEAKDISNKLFRLYIAAREINSHGFLSQEFLDLFTPDPGVTAKTEFNSEQCAYFCSQCSRGLATESSLIPHKNNDEICEKSYFVMPIAWMKDASKTIKYTLFCPNCDTKVGSFSWGEDVIGLVKESGLLREVKASLLKHVVKAECAVPSRAGGIYRAICTKDACSSCWAAVFTIDRTTVVGRRIATTRSPKLRSCYNAPFGYFFCGL